jgi:RNase adapter protein RapZ
MASITRSKAKPNEKKTRRRANASPDEASAVRASGVEDGQPEATRPPMSPSDRFVVLTGMSGSGKSQAMRALEDLGYFCVDNLPLTLLPTFAELTLRPDTELEKAAVVIDIREGSLLSRFPRVFAKLRKMKGLKPRLIFLEASDAALARRFSETRRPHPLAPHRSAMEGVKEERTRLAQLRKLADEIIDTSHMNVHELREQFMAHQIGAHRDRGPVVTFLSFGFKNGLPLDADLVFDVRFLPNPHYIAKLREKTGLDKPIVQFLNQFEDTRKFLDRVEDLLKFLIPRYAREGKSYVTVAIGCTGGRHRSVALAEALGRELKGLKGLKGVRLRVKHRDVAND